jgi:hypothetical protein
MPVPPIDDIILSLSQPEWKKVAMIIAKAVDECERRAITATHNEIASRIQMLVSARRLEAQGDLSNWRHSEIRLPA